MKVRVQSQLLLFLLFFAVTSCVALFGILSSWNHTPKLIKKNTFEHTLYEPSSVFSRVWDGMRIYFWNHYLPSWQRGNPFTKQDKKHAYRCLKYNPQIEYIIDTEQNIHVNHKRPTLFLHGWGDTKHSAKLLKAYCDVIPGDVITFQFRDHGVIIPKIRYSNLGQMSDVLSALYVLKWAKDTLGITEIDLFGYSRGGATVLNMIAVLHDATGKYDKELENIEISPQDRVEMLAMIQKGIHVLNCPLTDLNTSITARKQKSAHRWISLLEKLSLYKRDGLQGLDSAQMFNGLNLTMLLHFQYNDTIISNKNDAELYTRLAKHNPQTTFIVLGNNGGHLHTHGALAHTVHAFKQMFGGSYDPEYAYQYYATKHQYTTENLLLRPGKNIETVLNTFYASCTKEPHPHPFLYRLAQKKGTSQV